jgi:chaperonin cofactor prefoldin
MDELANTIATLREQNRRLNEEADHLAEMVRMSPGDAP